MVRLILVLCLLAAPATAAPEVWRLDAAGSIVGFTYEFALGDNRGSMPVKSADMRIDLRDIRASEVEVTLDASGARAGFFLATQAMRGPLGLDTGRHPEIRFRSTRISGTLAAAQVDGLLTVRGITRPVSLRAGLYRTPETDPARLDHLTVLLTGEIDRHAFGASGFPDVVGPTIGLRILARMER